MSRAAVRYDGGQKESRCLARNKGQRLRGARCCLTAGHTATYQTDTQTEGEVVVVGRWRQTDRGVNYWCV